MYRTSDQQPNLDSFSPQRSEASSTNVMNWALTLVNRNHESTFQSRVRVSLLDVIYEFMSLSFWF